MGMQLRDLPFNLKIYISQNLCSFDPMYHKFPPPPKKKKPVYRSGNPVSIPKGLFHGQLLSFALQCSPTCVWGNFELQIVRARLCPGYNWEKLTAKRTIGPQWHLPAPSTGIRFDFHTDIRILRRLRKCIWRFSLGFCTLLQIIHSALPTNRTLLHYSFVQTFFS